VLVIRVVIHHPIGLLRVNPASFYMPQAFNPNPFMPIKVLDFCNLNQKVASSFTTVKQQSTTKEIYIFSNSSHLE
jgi:hypothetical protein